MGGTPHPGRVLVHEHVHRSIHTPLHDSGSLLILLAFFSARVSQPFSGSAARRSSVVSKATADSFHHE